MAKYAVVRIGGSQYKVREKDELVVDKLEGKKGEQIILKDVLLIANNGKIKIGTPRVKGAVVEARLIEHQKGEKIKVLRFKAKSRYRKTKGFRPALTKVRIEKIQEKTSR